jgi:hypothetical protein
MKDVDHMQALKETVENFTGPVQTLQRTGTGKKGSNSEQIKPFDHFPEVCSGCGKPLAHADMIGIYQGTVFLIKGYHCSVCDHREGWKPGKTFIVSLFSFDWHRLNIPRSGKYNSSGVNGHDF